MTGLDCAVMCILINTQQHTHIPNVFFLKKNLARTIMCWDDRDGLHDYVHFDK